MDLLKRLQSDAIVIAASKLFDAELYRSTYLRYNPAQRWPLRHYLLLGERMGLRPNAFFDPVYYRRQLATSGIEIQGSLLGFYADAGATRTESPSWEFCHAWYTWQNPDWKHGAAIEQPPHPLRHFLSIGLSQVRDPSPFIDMRRYLNALGPEAMVAPSSAILHQIVQHGKLHGVGITADFKDLQRRQIEFRNQLNYTELRRSRPGRRNLVFLQCSPNYMHSHLLEADRDFDILLNYYSDPTEAICLEADHILFQRGTKPTGIDTILRRDPELLLAYDYVFFLDDDIVLSATDISRLFALMSQHRIILGQPLLTPDSHCAWPVFKDTCHAGRIVTVNSVEVMMPVFSRNALATLAWTFREAISGFGIDLLWGKALRDQSDTSCIALVGKVIARHDRPIDEVGGAFYRFMADAGINPKLELWRIVCEHGIAPEFGALGEADDVGPRVAFSSCLGFRPASRPSRARQISP